MKTLLEKSRIKKIKMKKHVTIFFLLVSFSLWVALYLNNNTVSSETQSPTPTKEKTQPQPTVAESTGAPVDSKQPNLNCAQCHAPGKTLPYLGGDVLHKDAHAAYEKGFHAKIVQAGRKGATCLDCHTSNGDMGNILPASDPKSSINRANIMQTCGKCHGNSQLMNGSGAGNRPFVAYLESVHGKALAHGNLKAAVCSDCHKAHDVLPANDSQSSISKFNVAKTCGQCHGEIAVEFTNSVHGTSLTRGNYQSPNCTDCHGIHSIKPRSDSRQALGLTSCSQCHGGVRLTQDYGIPSERVTSFEDSYHGRARHLGSDVVADCASCHGVHNILPSTNPKSLIHPSNLMNTCGQCHPGAGQSFATGKVHLNVGGSQDPGSIGKQWVRFTYLILITLTIGGMVAHNALIWRRKAIEKRNKEKRTIQRMSVNQRIQHWLLLSSFITLVISGFALEYPNILFIGSEYSRRIVHRIAAVVMLLVGVYHLVYLAATKEGRQWVIDMFPRLKDIRDFRQNLAYYLGGSTPKPKFARFRYPDKAEYWAVVWGTIIMGITGLMIWFKVSPISFWPLWTIDIAIAIHFYEAVLATLAIIVWHFYHVIFDPDVYPINWAFYDGRISEELFKEEHEQAYEEMKEAEERETASQEVLDSDESNNEPKQSSETPTKENDESESKAEQESSTKESKDNKAENTEPEKASENPKTTEENKTDS